ncbi:MAG: hypothetical protein KatS3mg015_0458 [Fimbriimonadales bacterium]|nr:MAG: hypothetical protein KatS3mg015_0458 [Fimbriimonadales bacterium]
MSCGHALEAAEAPSDEGAAVEEMVQDGYRLLAEGKEEEALFVAKAALARAPDDLSALALKGMVLEAMDDLPGAIACFERIVELNPSSTLDRIKLEQLQRRLYDTPALYEPRESNWPAILAGIGATLVVASLGVILALTQGEKQPVASNGPEVNTFQPATQTPTQPQVQPPTANAQPQEPTTGQASPSPMQRPSFSAPNYGSANAPLIITPDNLNGTLPAVGPSGATQEPPPAQNEARTGQPAQPPGDDNVIQPAEDPKKTGVIRITPHQDRSGNSSGSASESENIYRIALEKMKAGDYRGAIADFQKSLSGSSQPALTHQLIGRCYRQLGDFENAKSHLRRALQLFENSKAPGAQAGAEACRRELAAIGG